MAGAASRQIRITSLSSNVKEENFDCPGDLFSKGVAPHVVLSEIVTPTVAAPLTTGTTGHTTQTLLPVERGK
jgi:hypothetical protein